MAENELSQQELAEFLEWKRNKAADEHDHAIIAWQQSVHDNERCVWAVGPTPREAVEALAGGQYTQWGEITEWVESATPDDEKDAWMCWFDAGGTGFKAAGYFVLGGVVVTWWS